MSDDYEMIETSWSEDIMLGVWITLACTSVVSLILALVM
jgi:hypothetical protein